MTTGCKGHAEQDRRVQRHTALMLERMELPHTQALPEVTGRSAVSMRKVVVLPVGKGWGERDTEQRKECKEN